MGRNEERERWRDGLLLRQVYKSTLRTTSLVRLSSVSKGALHPTGKRGSEGNDNQLLRECIKGQYNGSSQRPEN